MSSSLRPHGLEPAGSSVHVEFPREEHWSGFLFQRIFMDRGTYPGLLCLLHWQVDSLPLRHLGSPQTLRLSSNSTALSSSWNQWTFTKHSTNTWHHSEKNWNHVPVEIEGPFLFLQVSFFTTYFYVVTSSYKVNIKAIFIKNTIHLHVKDTIQVFTEQRAGQETGLKDRTALSISNESHGSLLFTLWVATSQHHWTTQFFYQSEPCELSICPENNHTQPWDHWPALNVLSLTQDRGWHMCTGPRWLPW